MATSSTAICNSALSLLGEERITSLSEDTKAGRLCNAQYEAIRDLLLRNFTWNFSMARIELAQLASTPAYGWTYEYQLPTSCLRVVDVQYSEKFVIEGRKLLSNATAVYISYIKKEEDVSKFDPTFTRALVYRLAAEMAFPLTQSRLLSQQLFEAADREVRESRGLDSQESPASFVGDDFFVDARRVGLYD